MSLRLRRHSPIHAGALAAEHDPHRNCHIPRPSHVQLHGCIFHMNFQAPPGPNFHICIRIRMRMTHCDHAHAQEKLDHPMGHAIGTSAPQTGCGSHTSMFRCSLFFTRTNCCAHAQLFLCSNGVIRIPMGGERRQRPGNWPEHPQVRARVSEALRRHVSDTRQWMNVDCTMCQCITLSPL